MNPNRQILLATVITLCLAAGGCEHRAWKKAREENSIEGFQEYLQKYPKGKHRKLAQLRIERKNWQLASKKSSIEEYRRFIREFPGSKMAEVADKRIKGIARHISDTAELEDLAGLLIEVETNMGNFKFRLFPDKAPRHCRNIVYLALTGFYDGITIHRVDKGRMVVMGDPRGDGLGGPGYMIQAEPNDLAHKRGTVSMWRMHTDPDTAGSQFLVCLADMPSLDDLFTAFGQVVEGLENLDQMSLVKTVEPTGPDMFKPMMPIYINSFRLENFDPEKNEYIGEVEDEADIEDEDWEDQDQESEDLVDQ